MWHQKIWKIRELDERFKINKIILYYKFWFYAGWSKNTNLSHDGGRLDPLFRRRSPGAPGASTSTRRTDARTRDIVLLSLGRHRNYLTYADTSAADGLVQHYLYTLLSTALMYSYRYNMPICQAVNHTGQCYNKSYFVCRHQLLFIVLQLFCTTL